MRVGYMTNSWGLVVGDPSGVTSVKDAYYLSTGSLEEACSAISKVGFKTVEIFDGNLSQYSKDKNKFIDLLKRNNLSLLAVYSGANFIFKEIIEDELFKIENVAKLSQLFGAKHLVVGGGAVRFNGIKENDYSTLAYCLNIVQSIAEKHNLMPSYHPHLGTIVQKPEQLDKIMALTKINLCPDTGHIEAGGGSSVSIIKKYIDRIKYIHFKDICSGEFLPLGVGKIDFIEILNILCKNNFKGDITVEIDGYKGSSDEALKLSYDYLKKINLLN